MVDSGAPMECFFEEFVACDHVRVEGKDWSSVGAPSGWGGGQFGQSSMSMPHGVHVHQFENSGYFNKYKTTTVNPHLPPTKEQFKKK